MKREEIKTKKPVKKVQRTPKEASEIMRVKKKYNSKFVLISKLFELHLIAILMLMCFIVAKQIWSCILIISIYVAIILVTLILSKKSAEGTYISFQENKVVYRRKFLLRDTREEMLYKDIKEISFQYDVGAFTRFWQKHMNMGNIVIYPKKGNVLIYGIELTNVAPFDKLMVDIKNNIGDKIVNG